ncbi:MAG TPA: glucose PTS transporter subunit IIA, partial [Sphingomonas sp.]|nr:glucose PTS transporter subunit IIA [Sphingomonas sp.]
MTPIAAPLAGWLVPLSEVADPVFASGSMGEGFAIDPLEGLVAAPCDGTVSAVAPTRHSVTIETADGASLLIHVGLDTVALKGEGFELKVVAGERVRTGDPLIAFDMTKVALGARSLMTPVVAIGEGERLAAGPAARRVERGELVAELSGAARQAAPALSAQAERVVIVPMPNGIHARPAARLVDAAKAFTADIELRLADRRASARSTVALLKLAAKQGDSLAVAAAGPDAETAVAALAALIESGMGEVHQAAAPAATSPHGVVAVPGLAIGIAARLRRVDLDVPFDGQGVAEERAHLTGAIAAVRAGLGGSRGAAGEIAAAHLALLEDPELREAADVAIVEGRSAAFAWREAIREICAALDATGDALLRERIADFLDLERQVLGQLLGTTAVTAALPASAILLGDDLLPSEFQALDPANLAGIALAAGGPTSHVAVLAAAAGIPMLVALGDSIDAIADGAVLILDADNGRLVMDPDAQALDEAEKRLADRRQARAQARAEAAG